MILLFSYIEVMNFQYFHRRKKNQNLIASLIARECAIEEETSFHYYSHIYFHFSTLCVYLMFARSTCIAFYVAFFYKQIFLSYLILPSVKRMQYQTVNRKLLKSSPNFNIKSLKDNTSQTCTSNIMYKGILGIPFFLRIKEHAQ